MCVQRETRLVVDGDWCSESEAMVVVGLIRGRRAARTVVVVVTKVMEKNMIEIKETKYGDKMMEDGAEVKVEEKGREGERERERDRER